MVMMLSFTTGAAHQVLSECAVEPLGQAGDHRHQFGRLNWLWYVHLIARGQHAQPVLRPGIGRQRCGGHGSAALWAASTYLTYKLIAVDVRHPNVSYQYIRLPLVHNLKRFLRTF